MSFTSIVKNEVSKLKTIETEQLSELSAIIRNIGDINEIIKLTTENSSIARHIFTMVKDLYQINCKITVRKGYNFNSNYIYILEIINKKDIVLNDLGLVDNDKILSIPKKYIVDDDDLVRAYLKGVFLAIGSVNDPKTSRYHLEFVVDDLEYAEFLNELLQTYYLNSKILKRENKYMIYIKEAEKIGDFLRIIQAYNSVLYFEDIRIYRDHKNMTNRLNNCEQANIDKVIATSDEQIKQIEIIESIGGLNLLNEREKEAAIYRLKYKDASLTELSEIISIETGHTITKSGLNHRFNKIKLLANKITESKRKD